MLALGAGHVAPAASQSLCTGAWRRSTQLQDARDVPLVFYLAEDASSIRGSVRFSWGDLPICAGRKTGDEVHFEVQVGTQREIFSGGLFAGTLQLQMMKPGKSAQSFIAELADPASLRHANSAPLPALKALRHNGLARTPPMGWNSWNFFQTRIDDATVRRIADSISANGMREAGYRYINIDDGWEGTRDDSGVIRANSKFPDMKALAAYLHGKGLKLGIYSSPGPRTCGGFEGSYGHEEQDAMTYAEWGIDYLKYDWCSASTMYEPEQMRAVYQKMGEALQRTGRPILYSLCQYGISEVWKWGALAGGSSWRTSGDISDSYTSMLINADAGKEIAKFSGPAHWNDPDMLEVGNGGMSADEYRSHISLWALLAAPLITGNDVAHMSAEAAAILLQKDVIAIDQDALGVQATEVAANSADFRIWEKKLKRGGLAVGVFNVGSTAKQVTIDLYPGHSRKPRRILDVWTSANLAPANRVTLQVDPHSVRLLRCW